VKLISLNVGSPRTVVWQGRKVRTGIFKNPVSGKVAVTRLNLEGDGQADLRVHGGEDKAVYAYPAEHYSAWSAELSRELPFGQFGENLTVDGMPESEVRIGDLYRIGTALFQVSQPRTPCFKLGIKMEDEDFPVRFLESLRSGYYLRVLEPGVLQQGDPVRRESSASDSLSVEEICRLAYFTPADLPRLRKAAELAALSLSWRRQLRQKLSNVGRDPGS
jgi:MOSC domain-containing protein YiiM